MTVRIGTAGWSIPRDAAGAFAGEGSHLERYADVFDAVEINSSFHRPHRRSTYERWAASTPAPFRFAVKMPKDISHVRKLADADDALAVFIAEASGLGEMLGVLLLQLPPSLAFDPVIAPAFLATLRRIAGNDVGIACEPWHARWFAPDVDACLVGHRIARVAADPVLVPGGDSPGGWTGLRYHRLHGSPRVYYSSYGRDRLATLADSFAARRRDAVRWCVFDNTASGAATTDALTLRSLAGAAMH